MVLIVLEKVPASLRGQLSRWLMEIKTNVFLGKVSAMVREELFRMCAQKMGEGGFHMVHNWKCEQGFIVRSAGNVSRQAVYFDGIQLVRKPIAKA
ncbi:MAG: type I-E CRISPR-associated endoribonuclease Cas2e [Polyangia bacterium]